MYFETLLDISRKASIVSSVIVRERERERERDREKERESTICFGHDTLYQFKLAVDSVFNVPPIVCGDSAVVGPYYVMYYLVSFLFCKHLDDKTELVVLL